MPLRSGDVFTEVGARNRQLKGYVALASKTAGIDTAASLPVKVLVEAVKETTRNVAGRVDESAPERPAVEQAEERGGRP